MGLLLLGLVLFLGVHSLRMVDGGGLRQRLVARFGDGGYKGLYTLLSLAGFGLIVWGFSLARQEPVLLWPVQTWARHLAAPLVLAAFVLLAAAYVPGNRIKSRLHHPMVLGVKVWALAHLLANNTLADELLFGSFLVWAVLNFRSARVRDRAAKTVYAPGSLSATLLTIVVGIVAWALFAFWGHAWLIGVRPFS